MTIRILTKSPGTLTRKTDVVPFYIERQPHTLRELITEAVGTCLADYEDRREHAPVVPPPASDADMAAMREVGRFAFGVLTPGKADVDMQQSVDTAVQAVADGIVRVFRDGTRLDDLDAPLTVSEGDTFTFLRLTMLTGRLW